MGVADVIPGVSGGTIALILGIYERFLNAIKKVDGQAIHLLFTAQFKALFEYTDAYFLLAVLSGIATSVLGVSKLMKTLYAASPELTMAFFFGLILASIFLVGQEVKQWNATAVLYCAVGITAAVGVGLLTPATEDARMWYLFLCGMLAICSMILPGISGSFVLLIMGNYFLVYGSLHSLDFAVILPFAAGALVGIGGFSRFLSWLYQRYKDGTLALMTGFIAGSLFIIYPWKEELKTTKLVAGKLKEKVIGYERYLPHADGELALALLAMLLGVGVVWFIHRLGKQNAV